METEDPPRLDADNDEEACEESNFGGGGVADDDGDVPEGAIDSGFGPTAKPKMEGDSASFALGSLGLLVAGLALGTFVIRRRGTVKAS